MDVLYWVTFSILIIFSYFVEQELNLFTVIFNSFSRKLRVTYTINYVNNKPLCLPGRPIYLGHQVWSLQSRFPQHKEHSF